MGKSSGEISSSNSSSAKSLKLKIPVVTFSDCSQSCTSPSERPVVIKSIPRSSSARQLIDYRNQNSHPSYHREDFHNTQSNHYCSRCGHACNHSTMNHLPVSPLVTSNSTSIVPQSPVTENGPQPHSALKLKRNDSSASVSFPDELIITRRPSAYWKDIMTTRRPSAIMATIREPIKSTKFIGSYQDEIVNGSMGSLNSAGSNNPNGKESRSNSTKNDYLATLSKRKNRRIGDDDLSTALSTLYCKLLVILGIALPVTDIISTKIPPYLYHGFYIYLYCGSMLFVLFVYAASIKNRTLLKILKNYHEKANNVHLHTKVAHFGSFYLRVGAIAFGIGTMVYDGLEFGQYFEGQAGCRDIFIALTPGARMILAILQMQFIFLNTTELDMAKHKVIARFGLMQMIATNLCEWLYVLVEETRHEIVHYVHSHHGHESLIQNIIREDSGHYHDTPMPTTSSLPVETDDGFAGNLVRIINSTGINGSFIVGKQFEETEPLVNCERTNIMGSLVQDAAPFLFPCTIEYSLICAVILYEMWKKIKSIPDIVKTRKDSMKVCANSKSSNSFTVDCSRAHRGLFFGILITVMTIISMIMYFVLHDKPGYESFAMLEVTICETVMYLVTSIAVIVAMILMRDLKFVNKVHDSSSMNLDCTLLVLAQTGVYFYGMFSIIGSYFSIADDIPYGYEGLWAEIIGLLQTSIQTLFILNACYRRCKGAQQQRNKPGRETITFLLVANVSMWFINTLIKGRAAFRASHLHFFGVWAWTIITHVSMPLAIFYRFHSTICLFEIWKSAYKAK